MSRYPYFDGIGASLVSKCMRCIVTGARRRPLEAVRELLLLLCRMTVAKLENNYFTL